MSASLPRGSDTFPAWTYRIGQRCSAVRVDLITPQAEPGTQWSQPRTWPPVYVFSGERMTASTSSSSPGGARLPRAAAPRERGPRLRAGDRVVRSDPRSPSRERAAPRPGRAAVERLHHRAGAARRRAHRAVRDAPSSPGPPTKPGVPSSPGPPTSPGVPSSPAGRPRSPPRGSARSRRPVRWRRRRRDSPRSACPSAPSPPSAARPSRGVDPRARSETRSSRTRR